MKRTIQTGVCMGCGESLGAIAHGTTENGVTTWEHLPYCDACTGATPTDEHWNRKCIHCDHCKPATEGATESYNCTRQHFIGQPHKFVADWEKSCIDHTPKGARP